MIMQFSGFIFSDIRNLNSYRTPGRHLSPRRLLVESHPIGPDVPPSVKPLCCFLRSNIMVLNHFFNDIFCVLIILIRGLPQPLQGFLVILLDDIPLEIKDPDIIHCNFITGIRSPLIPFPSGHRALYSRHSQDYSWHRYFRLLRLLYTSKRLSSHIAYYNLILYPQFSMSA